MLQTTFPDRTPIDDWFFSPFNAELDQNAKQYIITDHGICDDGKVYTEKFQELIDRVSENGGGVIVVPAGTYFSGALFFKPGVDLYVSENGVLKGSDDITDYPLCTTRIEGEVCKYFPALINADGCDGLRIFGKGTIDGNGERSWKAFWLRRRWNPKCTNKDEQRPRLIFISNSNNVLIHGLKLQNSHFWTNHFYKCRFVKFVDCRVYSPEKPIGAPSTDAVDIDACSDVLIKNCWFHVNDDAIALKGGKGPDAAILPENGANQRILIEDCEYDFCHSCLTCGSESIHNRNVILRNVKVSSAYQLLWLKMRTDTPQHYEYITVENVKGNVNDLVNINPWKQFFNMKGMDTVPISHADNITIKNCDIVCQKYLNIKPEKEQYILSDFTLENLNVKTKHPDYPKDAVNNLVINNVRINAAE
ncbi:MAG: exopolygalacturonase [Clostridia bacterium]|nr:exopolygalacturonase [Clostridia bacterium]